MSTKLPNLAADLAYEQAAAAWLRAQADTFPLAQPVRVRKSGIVGVVTGISTCDASRRRVSYFSRHLWACRYLWTSIENLESLPGAASSATAETITLSA